MSKSKNVKLPLELIEILEKHPGDQPAGEKLLVMVKDHERLEAIAADIARQKKLDLSKTTPAQVIVDYITDGNIKFNQMQEAINELKIMVEGLEIYLKKIKEGK